MKRNASNVDGFIVRSSRQNRTTLDNSDGHLRVNKRNSKKDTQFSTRAKNTDIFSEDLSSSLADLPGYGDINNDDLIEGPIMDEKKAQKALRKASKQGKKNKKNKKKMKAWKKVLIVLLALLTLVAGGFLAMKFLWPDDALDGNWWDVFQNQRLQTDGNGRSNILIFGTEPEGYDGADLTDSIMLLSINQDDGSAYTVSLPRDLYVKYDNCPKLGMSAGKLNATFVCVVEDGYSNEDYAAGALKSKVGDILGLDVHYYVHLNWAGFEQIIDSVGGVDVVIESTNPKGIYDVNTGLRLANGEAHLSGAEALSLARARGSDGGYGLETSNFAREIHQQKIVKALVRKITSSGVLSNPAQALDLLGSLGDNIRTNFKSSEIQSLVNIAGVFNNDNMISLPLLDAENNINLVTTGNINGASVVVPTAGTYNYSEIHKYIKEAMSSDPIVKEKAVIDVLNGSGIAGLAGEKAETLSAKGYNIGEISNAPDGSYATVEIYQLTSDKPATAKALEELYSVKSKTALPFAYNTEADFVIVFAAN